MKLVFLVIIILVIGGIFVVREQQTNFKDVKSAWIFTKTMGKWIYHLGQNFKNIFVCAYRMTWKPDVNGTNLSSFENKTLDIVGGDKDEHGCIGSAGYSWCEPLQQCVRIWETPCTNQSASNLTNSS